MSPELLILSTRIALLTLVCSGLAALLAWWWRGLGLRRARRTEQAALEKLEALEQQTTTLKVSLAEAEQQCLTALEQRDTAEQQARDQRAEVRRLTDTLEQTHRPGDAPANNEWQATAQRLQARLEELEAEKSRLAEAGAAEVRAMETRAANLEARLAQVLSAPADTSPAEARMKALESSLATAAQELEQQRQAAQQREAALTSQVAELQQAAAVPVVAEDTARVRELESRLGAMEQEQQRKLQAAHAEIQELEARLARLQAEATHSDAARIADLEAQLAQANIGVKAQHEILLDMENQLAEAERRAGEQAQAQQTRLTELEDQLKQATIELQTLRDLLHKPAPGPSPVAVIAPTAQTLSSHDRPVPTARPSASPAAERPAKSAADPVPTPASTRDSLFRPAEVASLPPDQPSLADAQEVLRRMEQELDEKEQVLAAFQQEHRQRQKSLADLMAEEPQATARHQAVKKRLEVTARRLATASTERDRVQRHVRAMRRTLSVAEAHPTGPDNLMLIKGVKGVINSQLHAYGIYSFRQIAAWDEDDLQAFSELLSFKKRIWNDEWQRQARELHQAQYGETL